MVLTDSNGKLAACNECDACLYVALLEGKHHGHACPRGSQRHGSRRWRDYSTKEWDQNSGLCYFGARHYSPASQHGRRTRQKKEDRSENEVTGILL